MLRGDSVVQHWQRHLPNLRVVIRDLAHSSQHLNEHSCAADPILQFLMHVAVLRARNIARRIKDSQALRDICVGEARNQAARDDLLAAGTDMPVAPQRLDSLQKPSGKIVLNLEAPVRFCRVVVRDCGAA